MLFLDVQDLVQYAQGLRVITLHNRERECASYLHVVEDEEQCFNGQPLEELE